MERVFDRACNGARSGANRNVYIYLNGLMLCSVHLDDNHDGLVARLALRDILTRANSDKRVTR